MLKILSPLIEEYISYAKGVLGDTPFLFYTLKQTLVNYF